MERVARVQVWIYFAAIALGLLLGNVLLSAGRFGEIVVWPLLALLLYATFVNVPVDHVRAATRDLKFSVAILVSNFVIVPTILLVLLQVIPLSPATRLGVVMVMVVPCTDWYLTFTHLSGGDTARALAVTPLTLFVQLLLLPIYVRLLTGETFVGLVGIGRAVSVFVTLIVIPLAAAWITRWIAERRRVLDRVTESIQQFPVPLVALVVFSIAVSQAPEVVPSLTSLAPVVLLYSLYLIVVLPVGIGVSRLARFEPKATRALVFSVGTRNSFVVLPFALALPEPLVAASIAVVLQSLVELFGMTAYLHVVPRIVPTGESAMAEASEVKGTG